MPIIISKPHSIDLCNKNYPSAPQTLKKHVDFTAPVNRAAKSSEYRSLFGATPVDTAAPDRDIAHPK